jgi:hypothetical protein
MITATCLVIGALPYLEMREFRDVRLIPIANISRVETETLGKARIRFETGGSYLSRVSAERVRRAMRNCHDGGAAESEPARPAYRPPMAPRVNIREAW